MAMSNTDVLELFFRLLLSIFRLARSMSRPRIIDNTTGILGNVSQRNNKRIPKYIDVLFLLIMGINNIINKILKFLHQG